MGDVIEKPDGTVYGDGVNIAARLQALAEPGAVTVSDAVRGAVKGKVRANFEDRGEQAVKNIADPVRVYKVGPEDAVSTKPKSTAGETGLSLPDKPSIAVLPFTNMSGDPDQEYLTDGITEDIITELARFGSLFVIARNSSFSYKNKSPDVRQVGKELGVRYVLEGSIRRAGNRIRVTGQLIDALTGNHLWAEKYDRVIEDIFAVQEEITQSIVAAIAPQIDAEERAKARRRRPDSLSAYELAQRSRADGFEAIKKSDFELWERALSGARKALALDPRSLFALQTVAVMQGVYLFMFMGAGPDAQTRWREGAAAATKLIELDPSGSTGYAWMATFLSLAGRASEAWSNARRAVALNSNDVSALRQLAYVELMEGRPELALEHAQQAARLSPLDPLQYVTNAVRAGSCFFLRKHDEGLEYALLSVGAAPNWPSSHLNHVMVAVGAGDLTAASSALEAARRLAPEYIQRRLDGESAYRTPDGVRRSTLAFRIAAGLEDPSAADELR